MALPTPPNNNGGYHDNYGEYDYDFVDTEVDTPPDRLVCKTCHLSSRDPYLSVCCGHVFCKSCMDNVKKAANACPVCRNEEFVTFPQKEANREVKSLHIYCTNKKKGCEWQDEQNGVNTHLGNSDGCQLEEVKCPNECGKMIQRQYLSSRVETECPHRKVNCQYCHDTGEHQFIEGQHKEECPKFPVPCPNKCEVGNVPREDMKAHRKECPLEMIQCEYYSVGCEVRMARIDQEKHENEKMKEHLMKTKHKLTDTYSKLANTESKLTDTNNQLAIALQRINTLEVLSYLATDKEITRPTSCAVVFESSVGWFDKLIAMSMMSKSGDQWCPVVLKMSEFKDKKKNKTEWCSDPFYTHGGYKMCLSVDAAGFGDGKGTYLSAFLHLMKGPHDDKLTWPLRGEFKIKLLNQISDSEHHSKILIYDDRVSDRTADRVIEYERANAKGYSQFISIENLRKTTLTRQLLKDDCLFFQVTKL